MAKSRSIWTTSWRRKARGASLALVLFLGGCVNFGGADMRSLITLAQRSWEGGANDITLQQASEVPFATLGIRLGSGPQVMTILTGDSENGRLLWTTKGFAMTTLDGHIVRTAGLPHDLGGVYYKGTPPGGMAPLEFTETVDLPEYRLYGVPIKCRDTRGADETIKILGQDIQTVRIDETCASQSSALDWSFHNVYWLDPQSRLVWRSLQHISPGLDVVETEVLRPPQ